MTRRDEQVQIFQDTQAFYRETPALAASIAASQAATRLFLEGETPSLPAKPGRETHVHVTPQRTLEAALDYLSAHPDKRVAVHNFASATNPGGGVTRGSSAQEECLCRCSTLFPVLTETPGLWEDFYQMHRRRKNALYTDACIYSPGITVMKSDTDHPRRLSPPNWATVDVLTCAAPNLREDPALAMNPGSAAPRRVLSAAEQTQLHIKRGRHLLSVAAAMGAETVILGAFGCGAFQNDPAAVARAYKTLLPEFDGYFHEIRFAIYCAPGRTENFDAFRAILSDS